MANIGKSKQVSRPTLDVFLGLNENITGDTGLKYGECGDCENVIMTRNNKFRRVHGYVQMFEPLPDPIIAQWPGFINGEEQCIFAAGGKIYDLDKDTGLYVEIGSYTGDHITFFSFNDYLYALNTTTYQKWDGTGSFVNVDGYIPKVRINGVPTTGAGDGFEEYNLLTGKKHMTFNADGQTIYIVSETSLDSVDEVYVEGVLQTIITDYSVNLATGTITFTNPSKPSVGQNNVDIYWTKDTGTREEFAGNRFTLAFGKQNDTRIFFYGDPEYPARIRFTDLADGIASAEYIPADHYSDVGDASEYVKDLMKYQGKILIFKSRELHSGTIEYVTEPTSGRIELILTTLPLNTIETLPFNQGKMLNGVPHQVGKRLYRVLNTYVAEERNVEIFGERVRNTLNTMDLENAITIDVESRNQYALIAGKTHIVYNYSNDTFTRVRTNDSPTCGNEFGGDLFMAMEEGFVAKYSPELTTFNGVDLSWYWHMNFEDYGADYRRKSLKRLHVTVDPTTDQYLEIETVTDKDGLSTSKRIIDISHMTFEDMDFANFSFNTTYLPKPTRLKMNSKKFTYLSLRLSGGTAAKPLTLINMTPKIVYGGESK